MKFRDRIVGVGVGADADVREANCIYTDNMGLLGMN